jgi:RNA polymerase sigma-70 factor (ECF subfamily)
MVRSGDGAPAVRFSGLEQGELGRLWEQHRRWVAAILLAYKPRDVDVEDLLQDVAVSVVRHGHELRDGAAFRPWLRTIAINAARASARSEKLRRHARLTSTDSSGRETTVEPVDESHGSDREVQKELDAEARRILDLALELPDGYREPLLLKSLREMSYRQIGQTLGLPETTIETRIARARKMLRELAAARPAGEAPSMQSVLERARSAGVPV